MAKQPLTINTFQTPDGLPVSNGFLLVSLSQDGSVNNTQIQANQVRVQLDSNGAITGSPTFWPNAEISPSGTYYIISVYTFKGQLIGGPLKVVLVGSSFHLVETSNYTSSDLGIPSTSWPRSNVSRPTFMWDHSSTSAWIEGGTASVPQGGQYKSFLINGNTISALTPLPTVQTGFHISYDAIGMDKSDNIYFWSHGIDGHQYFYKTNTSGAALGSLQVSTTGSVWKDTNVGFAFVFYNAGNPYIAALGHDPNNNPAALWIIDATTMTTVNSIIQLPLDGAAGYSGNDLAMCTDGNGNIFISVFNTDNQQIELYKSDFSGIATQYLPFTAGPSTFASGLLCTQTGNLLVFLSDNSVSLLKSSNFNAVFLNVANIGINQNVATDIYFNYGLTAGDDTYITTKDWDGVTGDCPISLISAVDLSTVGTSTALPPFDVSSSISYFPEANSVSQVNYSFGYASVVACYSF